MDFRVLFGAVVVLAMIFLIQVANFDAKLGQQVAYQGACIIENAWIGYDNKIRANVSFDDGVMQEMADPAIAVKVFDNTLAEPCECVRYVSGKIEIK